MLPVHAIEPFASVGNLVSYLRTRIDALSIRTHLLVLVSGCFLPMLLFSAYVIWASAEGQLEADDARMLATARALAIAVEGRITIARETLEVLAGSPHLQAGDLKSFHEQALPIARRHRGGILLREGAQQLINTNIPFGASLPPATAIGLPSSEASPRVTDLFLSPRTGAPIVVVGTPVLQPGRPPMVLTMSLEAARFLELLEAQHAPLGRLMTILDRSGTIIARNIDHERFVGQKAKPRYLARITRDPEGVHAGESKDGTYVRGAFTHTSDGWTVRVALDRQTLYEPLYKTLSNILIGGIIILFIAGSGALWWGYRLSRSTRALVATAAALGRGELIPDPGRVVYYEAREVLDAQRTAARMVSEREAERDRSNAELRILAATLEQRIEERTTALVVARDQADRAHRAKTEFLASMSHELRTPLNAVIGFAEMIEDQRLGPITPARYREYGGHIRKSGEHLLSLINDVLDMSKLESIGLALQEDELDVMVEIGSAVTMMETQAVSSGVRVEIPVTQCISLLRADPRRLRQMLLNLLSNAIKFTPAQGRVTINVVSASAGLSISIADTGIGIAHEDITKALTRFGQIESTLSRRYAGTGLGLPLTKALMEAHGGTLELESQIRVGTTVTMKFPRERLLQNAHDLSL